MSIGQYRLAPVTLTDAQVSRLMLDATGNLKTVLASTGATAGQVQGNVASGAANAGTNPVGIGATYTSGASSVATTGTRVQSRASAYGDLRVSIVAGNPSANLNGVLTGTSVGYALDDSSGSNASMLLGIANQAWDGTNWRYQAGDANQLSTGKGLSATRWKYTSGTSPILSNTTTAVTIKTAGGTGVKNAIDSIQLTTTAFTASVPLAIRDGASGTVIWAVVVPTAGILQPISIVFEQPIVGTANTLLEVVTTTANTAGTVTLNVQGHTET